MSRQRFSPRRRAPACSQVLTRLRDQGKSILFISHKMREVMEISDRVTVLKKGRSLVTLARGEYDENRLASLMIGEDQIPGWQKSPHQPESWPWRSRTSRCAMTVAWPISTIST